MYEQPQVQNPSNNLIGLSDLPKNGTVQDVTELFNTLHVHGSKINGAVLVSFCKKLQSELACTRLLENVSQYLVPITGTELFDIVKSIIYVNAQVLAGKNLARLVTPALTEIEKN